MSEIVLLSGSPSERSRLELVLKYIGSNLTNKGFTIADISVRDLPKDVLFNGESSHPTVKEITELIQEAKGVIVGSPVYQGAYSGVLKTLFDILPQDVLEDKPVLPVMVGDSPSHLLALEYSLKPLLASLKGFNLGGVYLIHSQIDKGKTRHPIMHLKALERLTKQVDDFTEITGRTKTKVLQ